MPAVRESAFDARRSVEILSERDAFVKVFRNPDGSFTRYQSIQPVHFRDGTGAWVDIDNRLTARADGTVTNGANSFNVTFGPLDGAGVSVVTEEGAFSWRGVAANAAVTPSIEPDGVSVRYVDAWPGVDVIYRVRGNGVEEVAELKSRDAAAELAWETDGIEFSRSGQGFRASGRFADRVKLSLPEAFDAQGRVVDGEARTRLDAAAIGAGREGSRLTIGVDRAWLAGLDASRFPVRVDPTLSVGPYLVQAYQVDVVTGTVYSTFTDEVRVGNPVITGYPNVRW